MNGDETALWRGARIGVLGGTFDPPHAGHVRMAQHARDALGLDRVLWSVAPHPPHKDAAATSALPHRIRMVELALGDSQGQALTHIETSHDPSFTVDLLRACRARTRADLYFILGADSLHDLPHWKDPAGILELATLAVYARDDVPVHLEVPGPAAVVIFDSPRIDVSSTQVRELLAAGRDPDGAVAPAVAAYARENNLYARDRGAR
ncbi:MAG TPA: nicotinate (nicotinamide) nucleotide adenylyltransferase [Candidatus Krumholzibacteria bacterium]|nr:nicotinate (nicotinamide) nucleotide adenylyltransferase [Candidatus Krumholzibacteria bacterium]